MIEPVVEGVLREIVRARAALDALETTAVVRARLTGATWTDVGAALALTKEGARRRHVGIDPIAARRPPREPTSEEFHEMLRTFARERGLQVP